MLFLLKDYILSIISVNGEKDPNVLADLAGDVQSGLGVHEQRNNETVKT